MITALELVESKFPNNNGVFVLRNIEEFMVEFAKMHVQAALEAADKEVPLHCSEGVLNCYPESNII